MVFKSKKSAARLAILIEKPFKGNLLSEADIHNDFSTTQTVAL